MANPPIPPLFCSTPPPIDEDDDDTQNTPNKGDEDFGDFTNAYQPDFIENDVDDDDFNDFHSSVPAYFEAINESITKNPELFSKSNIPEKDINCDNGSSAHSETSESENKLEHDKMPASSLSSFSEQQILNENSMSPISENLQSDDIDKDFVEMNNINKDDSGRSSQSERLSQDLNESLEKVKGIETLTNVVSVEDISDDDSDNERLSPRYKNNFMNCDENSKEFFALEPIDVLESENDVNEENTQKVEKVEGCEPETENAGIKKNEIDIDTKSEECQNPNFEFTIPKTTDDLNNSSIPNADDDEEFDDFANFQDFTTTEELPSEWKTNSENVGRTAQETDDPVNKISQLTSEQHETQVNDNIAGDFDNEKDHKVDDDDDEDDDDFGDFSEAPVTPAPVPSTTTSVPQQPTATPSTNFKPNNLTSHLNSLLELMFPKKNSSETSTVSDSDDIKNLKLQNNTKKNMELAFVESAKALEYQWPGSNMRHSLIRSLGIDSRNIFLTEKWNPSMPRFAANLSFDPLKPSTVPLQPEIVASATTSSTSKPSMPAAEFDWKSSGLENPLDGSSKAEMAPQSIDAFNTESSASNYEPNEHNDDTNTASSINTSTATSTIFATTTNTNLSPTSTGSCNIDTGVINNNDEVIQTIDVGFFEQTNLSGSSNENTIEIDIKTNEINVIETSDLPPTMPKDEKLEHFDTKVLEQFENGSIARSTYAGPLKETHIFTPTKSEQLEEMQSAATAAVTITEPITSTSPIPIPTLSSGSTPKVVPIDFDYEKAAAGIIIDETVVRKEYRDIEYNPGFSLCDETRTITPPPLRASSTELKLPTTTAIKVSPDDFDDEFSDFQSVPPAAAIATKPVNQQQANVAAASVNGMILSPAILLPQAISIASKQPKIEWGNSAASIDPDELARIEQLFPQDKSNSRSESKKSTPTHKSSTPMNSLSISATIANQQQHQHQQTNDDDDWSDFVSVPISTAAAIGTTTATTTRHTFNPAQLQQSPYRNHGKRNTPANANDDEWSDFISSAPQNTKTPQTAALGSTFGGLLPQFNSGSWQNANFYNNPLSIYHRNHMNATVPNATPTKLQNHNYATHNNQKNNNNNNIVNTNNNYNNHTNNNFNQTQYLSKTTKTTAKTTQQLQHQQHQQQIQIMQDFSTSPAAAAIPSTYRPTTSQTTTTNYAAFQVGSAKIAPTVSLIPDLGFVAPAMPVHTAIINAALPKPSSSGSKK